MGLRPKRGVCDGCDKETWIVKKSPLKGNLCKPCNEKRLKDKRGPSVRKPTGEWALFQAIWNSRPRKSFISQTPLGNVMDPKMFFHVLGKGAYPEMRLYDKNIILTTPQEHVDWHNLSKDKLIAKDARWEKVFKLYEELKIKANSSP